jgi:hypothetical protein
MHRFRFSILAACGLMLGLGSYAFGDSFYLTIPEDGSHCVANEGAGACAPADTVSVDVEEVTGMTPGTSTATVTFTGLTVGTTPYMMYSVLFNVSGTFNITEDSVTVGGVTTNTTEPGDGGTSLDQYGSFNVALTTHDATEVVFDLDEGSWTSAGGVLMATTGYSTTYYSQGFDAAAQVITTNMGTHMDTAGFYGSTPEPTSMVLLGSILLAVGIATRRKAVQ